MTDQWKIKGRSVIVTGGASGLGAEYVEQLLVQGAKAVAIFDVAEKLGKETADKLDKKYSGEVIFIKCDVSKEEDCTAAFQEAVDRFKTIDLLVNNAGVFYDTPQLWRKTCEVNLIGLVSLTMKGISHMRKDQGGSGGTIVNISSVAALISLPHMPVYSATKIAVLHFTKCLGESPFNEETGIRLLTFCIGGTDTEILRKLETRTPNLKLAEDLQTMFNEKVFLLQKIESAVASFIHIVKYGEHGSTWLSIDDKDPREITEELKHKLQV